MMFLPLDIQERDRPARDLACYRLAEPTIFSLQLNVIVQGPRLILRGEIDVCMGNPFFFQMSYSQYNPGRDAWSSHSLQVLDLTISERYRLDPFRLHFNEWTSSPFNSQSTLRQYCRLYIISLCSTLNANKTLSLANLILQSHSKRSDEGY
ncbi:hypothetical protein K432DRAFT_62099 [Lepidopterella palustris CBS 459.81]|uniref:Uncharacterized protein n=1 Tax=Lepidopterella palustris CBS 459.81 TaxID=1314670 RepID=A0A8E2E8X6_9PEZI|nr:hypothetical protein K432DRAFT_62099 [Lepidopterella palustris CBS 459.81]